MIKRKTKLIVITICLAAFTVFHFSISQYHDYITVESPDGSSVAKIVWKRVFPYVQFIDAYLIVADLEENKILFKQVLVKARDSFSDIEHEFRGMTWDGEKVVLDIRRNHYKGPRVIEVK